MSTFQYLQRLQHNHKMHQALYEKTLEKLGRLRQRLLYETNPVSQLQWEQEICDAEAEERRLGAKLIEIERGIEAVKKNLSGDPLYHSLLRLDYREQARSFKQFLDGQHQVGTFLIHGKLDHGQRWLLNRLLVVHHMKLVAHGELKVIQIDLQRTARRLDVDTLWRELAHKSGLDHLQSTKEVIERIRVWWKTQTIIFIFHNVHVMHEEYMEEFVRKLWLPLASVVRKTPQHPLNYYLMFLVDYSDCVDAWSAVFAAQSNILEFHTLTTLEKLAPFPDDILANWIDYEVDVLPIRLSAQDLLDGNDGTPQRVLERICQLCGCSWYEQEQIWMKY